MPWPAGTCPPRPMDQGQPLRLPGNPHLPAPAALSLPGAPCFLPFCLLLPCPLPKSLLHMLSFWPSFSSFSPFLLFFCLFYFFCFFLLIFFFCSSMSLFLLFFLFSSVSHFSSFPLLFLFFFSFLFNSFSPPFYFPLFLLSFFSPLSLCFSSPFPLLLSLSSLFSFPRAQVGGPSRSRRGQCQQGRGRSHGAPGAPGVGGPGPIPPSCLVGANTAQPHFRGQKQWAGGARGKKNWGMGGVGE